MKSRFTFSLKTREGIFALFVLIIATVALRGIFKLPNSDTVQFHCREMLRLQRTPFFEPTTFGSYFDKSAFAWLANGRPSPQDQIRMIDEHRDALLRLGFLEKREFTCLSTNIQSLGAHLMRSLPTDGWNFLMIQCPSHQFSGMQISVISRKEDMPLLLSLLSGTNSPPPKKSP